MSVLRPSWATSDRRKAPVAPHPRLAVVAAAKRIRAELARADENNYGRQGWAGYIAREDVEAVVKAVIG